MKKLTAKKKIRQIRMFRKNLKKVVKRKNKKVKDKKINWLLLTEIGNSFVSSTVDDRVVQDTIKDICI